MNCKTKSLQLNKKSQYAFERPCSIGARSKVRQFVELQPLRKLLISMDSLSETERPINATSKLGLTLKKKL